MKKINVIVPIICLILNIILVGAISIIGLPSRVVAVIVVAIAAVGIAAAFVESVEPASSSPKGRLVIVLHFLTIFAVGISYFFSDISSG